MRINSFFMVVFMLALIASINDILIFCFGINYICSLIISALLSIIVLVLLIRKKKIVVSSDFEKSDILLFIAVFFFTLISGVVFPEYVYDTVSYHLYLQKYFPIDKVNFDFFPTRIYCICLFPLADRMYYIVRFLFGLRLGTLLSFFSPIVLYYQTKKILKKCTNDSKLIKVFSYGIFGITTYSRYIGTYYIDNIMVLFLLELIIMVLYYEKELLKDKLYTTIFALISGFSIAMKITAIFYLIPIYLYLLFVNKREIKFGSLLILFIFMLGPSLVYMVDNYIQTGSILYPYYNTIFKSDYFGDYNWVDERFTIKGIVQKAFWPLRLGFNYERYGDDLDCMDILFGLSYPCFLFSLVFDIYKKRMDTITKLEIIVTISYIFWITVMKGYSRYGTIVALVMVMIVFGRIINYLDSKNIKVDLALKISLIGSIYITSIALGIYSFKYFDYNNFKYILKDRDLEKYTIAIDGVWGAPEDTSGFVSLVRQEGTPIYNLHRKYFEDSEKALSMWEEKINNNRIYTIIDYYGGKLEENGTYKKIVQDGFEIKEIVNVYSAEEIPYVNSRGRWILVEIERER